jgi:Schlafen group 3, DNA/RNA helicase domain
VRHGQHSGPVEVASPVISPKAASLRFWYGASIADFVATSTEKIVGQLTLNSSFDIDRTQAAAWLAEIEFLQKELSDLAGSIFFEFNIPRMGRRIDVVLVVGPAVVAIEFKVGEKTFDRSAIDQVWDYGLDLKNFHEASHDASIVPILIATEATECPPFVLHADADKLYRPIVVDPRSFRSVVDAVLAKVSGASVDADAWSRASYHPTPTIIEAARALYAQHSVEAIARFDAGAQNLHVTSRRIEELVDDAQAERGKRICFVTGVPGAGKTLVGLNLATRREQNEPTHAVFLSGNGPLVAVLREALTRDEVVRRKKQGEKVRKGQVGESVKAFIQNVHHFRDDALIDSGPPVEHVVIFDEAQRAWNLKQTANFMLRKKRHPGFSDSEPEFLVSYMDRRKDWAVIVCLVGGGQEINTGEAGIDAWLDAVNRRFPDWEMFISSRLTDSEYAAGRVLDIVRERPRTHFDDSLHLGVSMRSFRAENVSAFVKALLDCDEAEAKKAFAELSARYPIAITRDLNVAKRWIRERARGTERYGLVASSKAMRLKPHAIDIRVSVDPVQYFLNGRDDTRSSYYLEDAATEFQVQGLELDWVCVNWDADFRFNGSDWNYHDFRGNRWCNISNADNRVYTLMTKVRWTANGVSSGAARCPISTHCWTSCRKKPRSRSSSTIQPWNSSSARLGSEIRAISV